MVRIFTNCIRIRSGLEGFYLSISDSEYSISVTDPYQNTKKLHFSDVIIYYNLIRQKLTIFVSDSVFEPKYKNQYDINNMVRIRSIYVSRPRTLPPSGNDGLLYVPSSPGKQANKLSVVAQLTPVCTEEPKVTLMNRNIVSPSLKNKKVVSSCAPR